MINMDMDTLRPKLEKIIEFTLRDDNKLTPLLINLFNELVTTIDNNPDKINLLKRLELIRNKDNLVVFDRYISIILGKITLSLEEKYTLLNLDIPYFQTLSLYNKLSIQKKLEYFDNKNFLSNLDIKRINYSLNNKKDILNTLIIPLIKKIPNNSLILENIPKDLIAYKELYSKFNPEIISKYLNKYYYLGSDLKKLISSGILKYAKKYSIISYNLDKETFNSLVLENPYILEKISPKVSSKLIDKEILHTLLNHNYNKSLNNTIKELNMLVNNNTKYLTPEYLSKCDDNSIYLYASNDLKIRNLFKSNPNYLLKMHYETLIYFLKNDFSEEERVSLLRNTSFINKIPDNYLKDILNQMTFPDVFNSLQNMVILNKVNNLNIDLKDYDKIFISGYLDSPGLVNISSNEMLLKMFSLISPLEVKKYLNYPYIYTKLKSFELVKVLIDCKLNIYIDTPKLIKVLRIDEIKYYLNNVLNSDYLRYEVLFNSYTWYKILGIKKELKEEDKETIKYLYDLVLIKGQVTLECKTNDLEAFKSIVNAYYLFGLNDTKELYEMGNKDISLEEVDSLGESYIKYFLKEFPYNIDIPKYLDILKTEDYKSKEIIDLLNEMNNTGYSNLLESKNRIEEYKEYRLLNEEKALMNILVFLKNYNNYLEEYQIRLIKERFLRLKRNNYRLRDDLYYEIIDKYTKEFINFKKLGVLREYLRDNNNYQDWFIKSPEGLKNTLEEYLKRYNYTLEIVLEKIIDGYLRKDNITKIIGNMGYSKPAYFDIIKYERQEKIRLKKINTKLKGIFKKYSNQDRIILLNYLAYGINPGMILDSKIMEVLRYYRVVISNFNGKVNVNKINLELDYISIINLTNDLYLQEYNKIYLEVTNIINYFKGISNKYISSDIIKGVFKSEITEGLDKYIIPLEVDNNNIVLKSHKMYLDGFKLVFSNIDTNSIEKLDNTMKNNLKMIIPYCIDKYFIDLTNNYNSLFKVCNKDYLSSWDKIIALLGQKN